MFDNLRDFSDSPLYEDEQNDLFKEPENVSMESSPATPVQRKKRSAKFLGMTAQQRFIIALMLMFTVCLIGTLAMFVLGKVSPRQEDKAEVLRIADIVRGRIVDSSPKTYTIEVTGNEKKIEAFVELLRPMGIKEFVRTGKIAIAREGVKKP